MSTGTLPAGHEEFAALAVGWALDALEPADQDRFERHQVSCPDCRAEVAAALGVATELAYGVPDTEPPPALRLRVLAATTQPVERPTRMRPTRMRPTPERPTPERPALPTGSPATAPTFHPALPILSAGFAPPPTGRRRAQRRGTEQPGTEQPGTPQHSTRQHSTRQHSTEKPGTEKHSTRRHSTRRHSAKPRGSSRRLVAALAAAALVAVSAGVTWEVTRPGGPAPTAAAQTATLTARDGTVATVVVRRDGADVVTDALPTTTGRGSEYVVWGVPAGDAAPRRLGSFTVTEAGLRSHPVRLVRPATGYPVLAISEEPIGSTSARPSRVLARGTLTR